jgi:GNAT superfamily N-acetyltransferase
MLEITPVRTQTEANAIRALVPAFFDWMRVRYPDHAANIDAYIKVQDIAGQMRDLLTLFAPPHAACLLARLDGVPVGMVMTKPHSPGTCEMNRMYVADTARGHGVGKALVAAILRTGRDLGYSRMVLSCGPYHTEALQLYAKAGFTLDNTLPDTGAGDIEVRMGRDLEAG